MLHVVMYHYVRDLPKSRFPNIKGMLLSDFTVQVDTLSQEYEMATLDSALAFLNGIYRPKRNLCLLTFDDGLREHYTDVAPILADRKLSAVFFLTTDSIENGRVASVHMSHFLMAELGFSTYHRLFLQQLHAIDPASQALVPDLHTARQAYSWDTDEVAKFKYAFNFLFNGNARDHAVELLFHQTFGSEAAFSRDLYLSWPEARHMQEAGFTIGGHSHKHRPLSALSPDELRSDLSECRRLLGQRLNPQAIWPFCYPYGRKASFSAEVIDNLQALGYACAFTSEPGVNEPGCEPFTLRRIDCNRAVPANKSQLTAAI